MSKSTLYTIFWLLALLIVPVVPAAAIWITVPSSNHIRVLGYKYDRDSGTVVLTRNVLINKDVVVKYFITVTGTDDITCDLRGERVFSPTDDMGNPVNAEIIPVPEALRPCLDHAPYTIVGRFHTWFGPLPLKPTYYFEPPRD